MMTVAELNAIKERKLAEINGSDIRIVVGLATCGLAAGAGAVFSSFEEEIKSKGIKNVKLGQAGCLGMCKLEPMVEVYVPGKKKVTYIKVTAEAAKEIMDEHVVKGNIVMKYVIGND